MKTSDSIIPTQDLSAVAAKASPLATEFTSASTATTSVLTRNVNAIAVPSGKWMELPAGDTVIITQELGGNFSVNWQSNLYRIAGVDADSLGREKYRLVFDGVEPGEVKDVHIQQVLKSIYDPEIPVNIIDLGLVYQIEQQRISESGFRLCVTMTLTSVFCGMGAVMTQTVKQGLQGVPNVQEVEVKLVFDPPWDRSMLSEAAKLQLNLV